MINFLFSSSFYIKFKAPNSTQIIDSINQHISDVSTFEMEWGKRCNVNTVTLNWKDFINLYTPSLDIVSDKLNSKFNISGGSAEPLGRWAVGPLGRWAVGPGDG